MGEESFKLEKLLGTGGFAQTWKARVIDADLIDEWGCDEVALKIPLSKQKEIVLKKEVELNGGLYLRLNELQSRNIVRYLGFGIYDGRIVMVMKYVSGGSLRNQLGNLGRQKIMAPERAAAIAIGVANGLSVIHKNYIVHRDIKPENILMDGDVPQISDLGIGRMLGENEMASSSVGTLFYMSPELLYNKYEGHGASFNTDIWSFGVTLYEMLCGMFPFGINEKMSFGEIAEIIKDDSIKLEFPEGTRVPPKLQAIVGKALRRNPSERYKTADIMLKDLDRFMRNDDDSVEEEIGQIHHLLTDPAKIPAAEAKFEDLMRKYPDSPRVYLYTGEYYNKCGNFKKAIDIFKKGIEKSPSDAMLHWGIGIAYQNEEDFRKAVESIEKALELGLGVNLENYAKMLLKTLKKRGGI